VVAKLLYACGDGWTAGAGIPITLSGSTERYYQTWPWFLSQNLKIPMCINDGKDGGSNTRIFRKTTNFIFDWIGKNKSPKDLMIVLGWTSTERTEIGYNGKYHSVTAHGVIPPSDDKAKKYLNSYFGIVDEKFAIAQTMNYMMNIRAICRGLDIQYYDFVALGTVPNIYIDSCFNRYNIELKTLYTTTWQHFINQNKQSVYQCGHPTIDTHSIWANNLARTIVL